VEAIGEGVPFVIQDYPPASGVVMACRRFSASLARIPRVSC